MAQIHFQEKSIIKLNCVQTCDPCKLQAGLKWPDQWTEGVMAN